MRQSLRFVSCLLACLPLLSCRLAEIDVGKFIRSPQLDESQLRDAIDRYGIKTIINLRGNNAGKDWYDTERAVTQELGVEMVDIGMSAARLPHRSDLLKLIETLKNAPRPILIHCLRGVDRTGEAAAIYVWEFMNGSREEALKMLSPEFGYTEAFMPAKKYFISEIWQGAEWAEREYFPCRGQYRYYDPSQYRECGGKDAPKDSREEDRDGDT